RRAHAGEGIVTFGLMALHCVQLASVELLIALAFFRELVLLGPAAGKQSRCNQPRLSAGSRLVLLSPSSPLWAPLSLVHNRQDGFLLDDGLAVRTVSRGGADIA